MSKHKNSLLSKIFRVKKTQIEMIKDRGFNIDDELHIFEHDVEMFKNEYIGKIPRMRETGFLSKKMDDDFLVTSLSQFYANEKTGAGIYVHYMDKDANSKSASGSQIKDIINILEGLLLSEFDITSIIIISQVPITTEEIEKLKSMQSFNIMTFLFEELIINKTKHVLVPKHTLLDDRDASLYMKNNNLSANESLQICFDDPIVKYYGGLPGQMFLINRKAPDIPTAIPTLPIRRIVSRFSITE